MKEDEKQPSKKKPNISFNSIFIYFVAKEPFKKNDVWQKQFLEDLGLLMIKNHFPLQFVESSQLKRFNMDVCPIIVFPSRFFFSYEYCLD